jgi:Fe-Mn family superoxide dismutase
MNDAPLAAAARTARPFTLPALPWAKDALEPVISERTVDLHHGKHHRGYVDKLNKLVTGTDLERATLHEVVTRTYGDAGRTEIFDNAGQALNHAFYWQCLAPQPTKPAAELRQLLERDLGGYRGFVPAFTKAATAQFGSGWAWLVADRGTLAIVTTSNAETPLARGQTPLLVVDVWEHAYYLDYQNNREQHVRAVVEKRLDWDFAAECLRRA